MESGDQTTPSSPTVPGKCLCDPFNYGFRRLCLREAGNGLKSVACREIIALQLPTRKRQLTGTVANIFAILTRRLPLIGPTYGALDKVCGGYPFMHSDKLHQLAKLKST